MLGPKKFLVDKNFWSKKFKVQRNFGSKKILRSKKCCVQKFWVLSSKILRSKKNLGAIGSFKILVKKNKWIKKYGIW